MVHDRYDQSDWEESSEEEEEKLKPASAAAPPRKKGTLKQKLAEKAASAAARAEDEYDEDAVLDPREKAARDRQREVDADLKNAADLLGPAALGGEPLTAAVPNLTEWDRMQEHRRRSSIRSFLRNLGRRKISRNYLLISFGLSLSDTRTSLYMPLSSSITYANLRSHYEMWKYGRLLVV